jgi:predicted anti-sigma-YlaC factor YlaD
VSTHVREELGAYVLGALSDEERETVREHLDRCPQCRDQHAEIAELPGLLDLAAVSGKHDLVPLAPALEERVLDQFAREVGDRRPRCPRRRGIPRRRWALAGGGTLVTALAALLAVLVLGGSGPSAYQQLTLRGTPAAPKAGANAKLESVRDGTRVSLKVWKLPGDPAAVYELRCDAPGWSASAGTFHVDRQGKATVVLTTAARRGEYDYMRIVRHDRDAAGHARWDNVLAGRLS